MQINERFVPQKTEPNKTYFPPHAEAQKGKEKTWYDKIGTSIADLGRDIVTANDMAKDKFDGDSALMHAARGGATTLIGVGLEAVFDKVLANGIRQGEVWASRIRLPVGKETIDKLAALGREHPRLRYFVESASKDVVIGLAYNGLAYFSRPMLPSAEAKHLLGSLAASAVDSMGPKGLEPIGGAQNQITDRDRVQAARLLEVEAQERETAYVNAPDPKIAADEARTKWLDDLGKKRNDLMDEWKLLRDAGVERKQILVNEQLPRVSKLREHRKAKRDIKVAAVAAGKAAGIKRDALFDKAMEVAFASEQANNALKKGPENPDSAHFSLKTEAQKLIKYANPATLLGIDWMTEGLAQIVKNTKEVRKIRKEKGIVGKSVEMQKKDEWKKPWEQRGKYENKGKWQGNRDKVYYGKSDWNASVKSPPEEIPYEKFD